MLLASALSGLIGCTDRHRPDVKSFHSSPVVTKSVTLEDVPSGSAIHAAADGSFWIVSDDAPYLYHISRDGLVLDSTHLSHLNAALHRIPKPDKPDYEAVFVTNTEERAVLYAFGSGSLQHTRESALQVQLWPGGLQRTASLAGLYERIRSIAGINLEDFNIEGAATDAAAPDVAQVVFFNRGTGHLIFVNRRALIGEIFSSLPEAPLRVAHVTLPGNGSYSPGFSDGVFLDNNQLLFCASSEATTDWHTDGEVLGSHIGLIDLTDPAKPRLVGFSALVGKDGTPVKDKLEGIDLVREKDGTIHEIVGVVDNDDGTSKLLHINYSL